MKSSMFDAYAQEIQEMLTAKMYIPQIARALEDKYPEAMMNICTENLRHYCQKWLYIPSKPAYKKKSLAEEIASYADRMVQDCERLGTREAYKRWRWLEAVDRRGEASFARAMHLYGYDIKTLVERQMRPHADDFQKQIDAGMTYTEIRKDFERYNSYRYGAGSFKKWIMSNCNVDGKRCQKGGSRDAKPWKRKVRQELF